MIQHPEVDLEALKSEIDEAIAPDFRVYRIDFFTNGLYKVLTLKCSSCGIKPLPARHIRYSTVATEDSAKTYDWHICFDQDACRLRMAVSDGD